MPILGIMASQILGHLAVPMTYESIASVTLTASASTITFSGIPSIYKHLQVRGIGKTTRVTGYRAETLTVRFNGDAGSNYYAFVTDGTYPFFAGPSTAGDFCRVTDGSTANYFSGFVIDILDYTNTNKNKTTRTESGGCDNGGGSYSQCDMVWNSTAAITSLVIYPSVTTMVQYTSFALYGIGG